MSWLAWIGAVFGGLVVIDFVFVGVIVTIDVIKNWRDRR
jgi:hypothetical protein